MTRIRPHLTELGIYGSSANLTDTALSGRIVGAFGRQYEVKLQSGESILCFPRGKKSNLACGDHVMIERVSPNQGVIAETLPRSSLLYRSDAYREKLIAANLTQIIIVVATEPGFSDQLVSRSLIAAQQQNLRALIALNKVDIVSGLAAARAQLMLFKTLGYPIIELSALNSIEPLRDALQGHTSLFIGQSGMGKSTLINGLIPTALAATREISSALDSGKHTTTHTRLYPLNETSALIDSPGLQEFGLAHLTYEEVEQGFIEFKPYLGHCRFRNCRHDKEPDCAITQGVAEGNINPQRLQLFLNMRPRS